MQGTWNTCRHPGSLRAGSPTRKSCRHTEQHSASPAASTAPSAAIAIAGSRRTASAGRPLPPPVSNRSLVSSNGELMALICFHEKENVENRRKLQADEPIPRPVEQLKHIHYLASFFLKAVTTTS